MIRHDVGDALVEGREAFKFDTDIKVAARSRMPVLISGTPQGALAQAQAIAGRLSRAGDSIPILTCDVADCGDLGAAFSAPTAAQTPSPRASILLLREVHALTRAGQSVLRRLMVTRPLDAPRVFASSSVSLYERVKEGLFDPDLFYYLNTIHIVTPEVQNDERKG